MGRNHRAQFQHIFTFLMVAFLTLFILLIGWHFLRTIFSNACQLQEKDFQDQLDEALTNYITYGSVKTIALPPPCDVEKICFVDSRVFTAHGNPWQRPFTISTNTPTFPCRADGPINTIKSYDTSAATLTPNPHYRNRRIENIIASPPTPPPNIFFITTRGETVPLQYEAPPIRLEDFCSALCFEPRGGLFHFQIHGFGKYAVITEVN